MGFLVFTDLPHFPSVFFAALVAPSSVTFSLGYRSELQLNPVLFSIGVTQHLFWDPVLAMKNSDVALLFVSSKVWLFMVSFNSISFSSFFYIFTVFLKLARVVFI